MPHDPALVLLTWVLLAQLLAIGGIIGVIWAVSRWRPADCSHEDLLAVAVSKPDGFAAAFGSAPKTTAILWRCVNCDHVESSAVGGSWTLAEVQGWGHGPMPADADTVAPAGADRD